MVCYCGNDTWLTVRIARNTRLKESDNSVLIKNDNYDTRFIICRICGKRYITETSIKAEIINKGFQLFVKSEKGESNFRDPTLNFPE